MKSMAFKITSLVSILVIAAVFFVTLCSEKTVNELFDKYVEDSLVIRDKYPYVEGQTVVIGPVEKNFLNSVLFELLKIGVPITLLAMLGSFFIAKLETKPLKRLTDGAKQIAIGNLDYKADDKGSTEIRMLAKSFNLMASELKKAQMLRKQFFADAAHELKTPIAVIRGNLEGMVDGIIPANNEMLTSLLVETDFLTSMIEDIKSLALADSGQLTLNKQETNINDIVTDCYNNLKAAAALRNIKVAIEFKEDPIIACVDRERIYQVFYNFLVNSGKYSPEGGTVSVSTEVLSKNGVTSFKFTIHDNGVGIAEEELPFIFERFYRVDKSRDRKTGGIGLGLSIVKKLVELHGGCVSVDSVIGKGSTFYVIIPLNTRNI